MLGETVTAARTTVSPNRSEGGSCGLLGQAPGLEHEGAAGKLGFNPLHSHSLGLLSSLIGFLFYAMCHRS